MVGARIFFLEILYYMNNFMDLMAVILENFERLTVVNYEVKEQLKLHGDKTTKLVDMLVQVLSRTPAPPKP